MEAIINIIQIGLAIGNSRYHWAWFLNTKLQSSWDTEYLAPERFIESFSIDLQVLIKEHKIQVDLIPIYLVSVVPIQTEIWQKLPQTQIITLSDIPMQNLYPTLGIDRALAAFGAGEVYGYPVLVIDGGTALTITGIDDRHSFIGGAILPGLRLQISSLYSGTAALPQITLPPELPPRWSDNTPGSIASGILHTISAGLIDFIRDWQQLFPKSQIVFTGGDGELLTGYVQGNLQLNYRNSLRFDRHLLFHGLSVILKSI
ncbi:pantothenate kinase [Chamaesiphon minutus]|uniref:Type III pantothenate kinase n=1 Tax=Chamaesiphon minutus (strain ATCC 27169 / PCC 6605) TaxID=1173020 RepID=K9UAW8_CHAP6|nr:pantothenate kinase [Chamaesiphon minutus]AFY91758.1 pantothenate kinase, type III [Chamaesiphon minutus PCC 6605]